MSRILGAINKTINKTFNRAIDKVINMAIRIVINRALYRVNRAIKLTWKVLKVIVIIAGVATIVVHTVGSDRVAAIVVHSVSSVGVPLILLSAVAVCFVLAFMFVGETANSQADHEAAKANEKSTDSALPQEGVELIGLVPKDLAEVANYDNAFALRQEIASHLDTCQIAEHDFRRARQEIATRHNESILGILTQWISTDYIRARPEEVETVERISGQQRGDWVSFAAKKIELQTSLLSTKDDLLMTEVGYKKIGGVVKGLMAKGEDKVKILEARALMEKLRMKVAELEPALKDIEDKIKSQQETCLQACCKNLDQLKDNTPLGKALGAVMKNTLEKIAEEWHRHRVEQKQALEAICQEMADLTAMYSINGKALQNRKIANPASANVSLLSAVLKVAFGIAIGMALIWIATSPDAVSDYLKGLFGLSNQ